MSGEVQIKNMCNSQQEAIDQAIQMYSSVRKRLEEDGHILSPIEVKESTTTSAAT
jgi:hypothetical protein